MQNKFFGSKINTVLLLILIIITGFLLWKMNHGGTVILSTDYTNDQYEPKKQPDGVIKKAPIEKKEPKTPTESVSSVLQKIFQRYKNGEIQECFDNNQTYYYAADIGYDAGGEVFDLTGKVVGVFHGYNGRYTGIQPKNCTDIYRITPNTFNKPGLNTYNLK